MKKKKWSSTPNGASTTPVFPSDTPRLLPVQSLPRYSRGDSPEEHDYLGCSPCFWWFSKAPDNKSNYYDTNDGRSAYSEDQDWWDNQGCEEA